MKQTITSSQVFDKESLVKTSENKKIGADNLLQEDKPPSCKVQTTEPQITKFELPGFDWHQQLRNRINTLEQLNHQFILSVEEQRGVLHTRFKFAITPYLASLIDKDNPNCPIRKQFVPSIEEIRTLPEELNDPCAEEANMPTSGLVHRYPDRVLLLITDQCASYCRFCTRKRLVGQQEHTMTQGEFGLALKYIKEHPEIRDVLISGGDPLVLSDEKLEFFLKHLRKIKHIEILRIGTRIPVVLPQRITPKLCDVLKKYHPLYINIHFNHPKEITEQTKTACELLATAGIPLGSQSVLLKGINDKPQIFIKLVHELLKIRVRPYYVYQCDVAVGTSHFRTQVGCGIKIIEHLRGFTTGLAIPTFVIDAPGGGGKIPIGPDYLISKTRNSVIVRNYEQKIFVYPELK